MNINNIHWHDSKIISSIELPEKDCFVINIEYPINWSDNEFSEYSIVFNGFTALIIDEIPYNGCPTILSASVIDTNELNTIKLETTAGFRIITAKSLTLIPTKKLNIQISKDEIMSLLP
ncbi:hypothetical protein DOJK_00877 [Patescibacteria group bacterium]|nr:hypothetical protein DOJK_00877 [Patescibacteria group bacterium]